MMRRRRSPRPQPCEDGAGDQAVHDSIDQVHHHRAAFSLKPHIVGKARKAIRQNSGGPNHLKDFGKRGAPQA